MRAQDTRAAEEGEHGVEALGRPELLLEQVEGVRQRIAQGHAERAQPEGAEHHPGLVPGAHDRVGEVAVVEAHPRIDDHALHAPRAGMVDAPCEVLAQPRNRILVDA